MGAFGIFLSSAWAVHGSLPVPWQMPQPGSSLPFTRRGTDVRQGRNNAHIVSPAVTHNSPLPSPLGRLPPMLPEPPAHFSAYSGPALPGTRGKQCLAVLGHTDLLAGQPPPCAELPVGSLSTAGPWCERKGQDTDILRGLVEVTRVYVIIMRLRRS